MILDTSAIIAILQNETPGDRLVLALEHAEKRRVSAATILECSIVICARYGDAGDRELDLLVYRLALEIVPVTSDQVDLARSAWRRFGKGRHEAALNFGDCFSYALAKSLQQPLLFVGNDFSRTDLKIVEY
mgnify:CR=1 FL=1